MSRPVGDITLHPAVTVDEALQYLTATSEDSISDLNGIIRKQIKAIVMPDTNESNHVTMPGSDPSTQNLAGSAVKNYRVQYTGTQSVVVFVDAYAGVAQGQQGIAIYEIGGDLQPTGPATVVSWGIILDNQTAAAPISVAVTMANVSSTLTQQGTLTVGIYTDEDVMPANMTSANLVNRTKVSSHVMSGLSIREEVCGVLRSLAVGKDLFRINNLSELSQSGGVPTYVQSTGVFEDYDNGAGDRFLKYVIQATVKTTPGAAALVSPATLTAQTGINFIERTAYGPPDGYGGYPSLLNVLQGLEYCTDYGTYTGVGPDPSMQEADTTGVGLYTWFNATPNVPSPAVGPFTFPTHVLYDSSLQTGGQAVPFPSYASSVAIQAYFPGFTFVSRTFGSSGYANVEYTVAVTAQLTGDDGFTTVTGNEVYSFSVPWSSTTYIPVTTDPGSSPAFGLPAFTSSMTLAFGQGCIIKPGRLIISAQITLVRVSGIITPTSGYCVSMDMTNFIVNLTLFNSNPPNDSRRLFLIADGVQPADIFRITMHAATNTQLSTALAPYMRKDDADRMPVPYLQNAYEILAAMISPVSTIQAIRLFKQVIQTDTAIEGIKDMARGKPDSIVTAPGSAAGRRKLTMGGILREMVKAYNVAAPTMGRVAEAAQMAGVPHADKAIKVLEVMSRIAGSKP